MRALNRRSRPITLAFIAVAGAACGDFLGEEGDDSRPSPVLSTDAGNEAGDDARTAEGGTSDAAGDSDAGGGDLCGNGNTDVGEVCDDGNNVSGDGCKGDCSGFD